MADAPVKHDSITDIVREQFFIFIDGKPMAFGISCSLDTGNTDIDISNKMVSSGSEATLPGISNWSISSESLVTNKTGQMSFHTLLKLSLEKKVVDIIYGLSLVSEATLAGGIFEPDLSNDHYKGKAYINSLNHNSTNGDMAKCSVTMKGSGALVPVDGTPPTT